MAATEPDALAALQPCAAAALRLDGLTRRYGERDALAGVTLTLPAGHTLLVLGPNGAGKTTLLRVLATLLRPHAGTVHVLGSALPDAAWAVRGRVGLLGHEPLLYRELSARENLRFYARLHGVGEARVQELLVSVGMERRAEEPLRELSRGMVQRVALARAVLHDPELLLLDEPHANLDPAGAELAGPLIGADDRPLTGGGAESATAAPVGRRRTRVLCSHDPDADLAQADLVLGLRGGRPALLAAPAQVTQAEIGRLYR